jgi:hypothetical protein
MVLEGLEGDDERLVFVPTGRYHVTVESAVALSQRVNPLS